VTMERPSGSELLARLPRTFRPALNDQLRNWELLFPAEQRKLEAQLKFLAGLPGGELQRMFAPVAEVESRMNLPRWDAAAAGLSVQDTGVLARSPLYPRWRSEVEKVFARIDEGVEKDGSPTRVRRLVICTLPSGLPASNEPFWPRLASEGTWVRLDGRFERCAQALAAALAARRGGAGLEPVEQTWIFECESTLGRLAESTPATVLSWAALAGVRREFLSRLNTIRRSLTSVDQTNQELKQLDMGRLLSGTPVRAPRVREFVRSLFLSGNGSLVFDNSFVQWGASETLRRVQPQVLIAGFGIRPKLKPFSSVVLFEDQSRSNPVGDEDDPGGSLLDGLMLAEYVQLAARRYIGGRDERLTLMTAGGLDRVLVLGASVPGAATERWTGKDLIDFALGWLGGGEFE